MPGGLVEYPQLDCDTGSQKHRLVALGDFQGLFNKSARFLEWEMGDLCVGISEGFK